VGAPVQEVVSCGELLHIHSQVGALADSSHHLPHGIGPLRDLLDERGYLFLRGVLPREQVLAAGAAIFGELAEQGLLDHRFPASYGVLRSGADLSHSDMADGPYDHRANEPLLKLLDGPLRDLFALIMQRPVRYHDRVLVRVRDGREGSATWPHCDNVFMGRGTAQLLTAWIPLAPYPPEVGGLMVLEGSHRSRRVRDDYGLRDVDEYCANSPEATAWLAGDRWSGEFTRSPREAQDDIGGRWLTAAFEPGDLLTFTPLTLHGSTDNRSNRVRISIDTRYQPQDEPMDRRWEGTTTIGHGSPALRGRIC